MSKGTKGAWWRIRDFWLGKARHGGAGQELGEGTNGAWWRYAIQDAAWPGWARRGKSRARAPTVQWWRIREFWRGGARRGLARRGLSKGMGFNESGKAARNPCCLFS